LEDIGQIPLKMTESGLPVTVKDIGKIRFGHSIRYGALTRNADGESVGGIVLMLKGANSSEVISSVKDRMEQVRKTLPEGLEISVYLDRSELIQRAIDTVTQNLIEGALIVIFVLVLMLGNFRAGLVVASVIPLAMLFALGMMDLFGVSGNLMSLGAIDFGLIVDGAVIIVEAVMHRIAHSPHFRSTNRISQEQMDQEVRFSAGKMMNSAAFGQIIILIVYLPILALVGIEGKMFKPMAQTVSFAILGAFIFSLTYVPMIASLVLSKKQITKEGFSDKMMKRIHSVYQPLILWFLNHKTIVLGAALIGLLSSVWIFSQMGGVFIPNLDEGDFAVETRLMPGTSMDKTMDVTLKAAAILKQKFPEVKEVIGKIGTAEIPTDPMGFEACDLMVLLKPKKEWTTTDSKDELAERMQTALSEIPGVAFGFQQPIQMRFNELMTGARQDVAIKIYGEDLDELARQAEKMGALISKVNGLHDLYIENITGLPQMVASIKRDQLAVFGLHVDEVNRAIQAAFAGAIAGKVYEGEKRFDLVVRLDSINREQISDLKNLYIGTRDGSQIPLSKVADVEFKLGPNQIQRDDAKRRITVAFNVRGRDVESLVTEINQICDQKLKLPPGYYFTIGGQFKNLVEAKERLSIAVPLALALIFILLFFSFNSLKQSLLIFSAIPLSAIGGIWALWFRDMPFSISAGVGFIALFGVAVLNGIVLMSEFNSLKKDGVTNLEEIILKGTKVRIRPVLMTAMVASLGFMPMALSSNAGAEVQKPLATVVIGGLVSA
ncbi:MAG TPA: CusA/CzcA family heavy metal efflux RND transporter, partial [Catalimonadaceae bacterium]|nr:CusA/CzcA family heavy metal efflux RND transporter [Catalimonadaceae bacterium]